MAVLGVFAVSYERVTPAQEDVGRFLATALNNGIQYDVVVIDPPKLAPSRKVRVQGFRFLAVTV